VKRHAIIGALLALTACTATRAPEPVIRTVEVAVPAPQPCPARVAAKPRYADQDVAAQPDIFEQVRALLTGIQQRAAREEKLEAAVTSCGGQIQ
jgi:hypothetical protein